MDIFKRALGKKDTKKENNCRNQRIIKELKIRNPNISKRTLEKILDLFLQEIKRFIKQKIYRNPIFRNFFCERNQRKKTS